MKEILLISNSELSAELELSRTELAHYGYSFSSRTPMARALEQLRSAVYAQVLINAEHHKLEALDLVRTLRETYKNSIKVFVYLPQSSASEGSKFGSWGAEVEDELSIVRLVEKLPQAERRAYSLLDEHLISFYSMHGGAGTSMLAILLSYALGHFGISSVLMESSNNPRSIKDILVLDTKAALLTRDRNREIDQDSDWFSGFVSRSHFLRETFYLHLFNSLCDKDKFLLKATGFCERISSQIQNIANRFEFATADKSEFASADKSDFLISDKPAIIAVDELQSQLQTSKNNLQLLANELNGSSYSLFEELFVPASKLAKHFLLDIGSDISSPINKQFLRYTRHLVFLMKDISCLYENFQAQKKYLEDCYKLNIIPVLAPGHHYYADYSKFTSAEWQSLLGLEPLILPYCPEEITAFVFDHAELGARSPLMKFVNELLERLGLNQVNQKGLANSLMDFLVRHVN